jgi:hypothetical protein
MGSIGCGEAAPPFDELPLRDALRAEPEAIAAMPAPARARLAARLEAARVGGANEDQVRRDSPDPLALVTALDAARAARPSDALVVGVIADGVARPTTSLARDGARGLPSLEGASEGATAPLELAALDGPAKEPLVALLEASGARRIERVSAWPTGAIAIDDVVYVNAAWLVALSPTHADGGVEDGGASAVPSSAPPREPEPQAPAARSGAPADGGTAPLADDAAAASLPDDAAFASSIEVRSSALSPGSGFDGGVQPAALPTPADDPCASSCSADSSDDSGDSCGSSSSDDSSDSCGGSNDNGGDACSGAADDGGDACASADPSPDCQVAGRPSARGRPRDAKTLSWLMAPLAFLLFRRRP